MIGVIWWGFKRSKRDYNENVSQIAMFYRKTAFEKEIGIIKVAYASDVCLVFWKIAFPTLADVQIRINSIIYTWCNFAETKKLWHHL